MTPNQIIESIKILIEHAQEAHPHFESTRGKEDIAQAQAALTELIKLNNEFPSE